MQHQEIHNELKRELATILNRHDRISAHLRESDREPPKDWQDLATFRENDEVLEALDEHTLARADALVEALHRIERGEWGACTKCKKPIPAARLKALPTAETCIKCAA